MPSISKFINLDMDSMEPKSCDHDFQTNESSKIGCKMRSIERESIGPQKIAFPKHVFYMVGNEFCERFSYTGLQTILVLYLNEKLGYSENDASALFHGFVMMIFVLCIVGGIIADVWLGKFKTILYLSIVYALGCATVSMSAIPNVGVSPQVILTTGLVLVAIGSGGIKSSVCAFGGDQFKLPDQAAQMSAYFSVFYFSISVGTAVSTIVTPVLRSDVHCFGENDCYSLAFGVPAILMIIAFVLFVIGKSSYTNFEVSSKNLIVEVIKCVSHAIKTKFRERRRNPRKNLLDYSIDKYGKELVEDIRALRRIMVLYLPIPMYWTLFTLSSSRFTFQAKRMNGDIGFYHLKPDQMQMVPAILLLVFVPFFDTFVYPLLNRIGVRRLLQKMAIGGFLTAASYAIAGLVEFQIEASPKNALHMLWQLPQFFMFVAGEVMLALTGLEFSYLEAPKTMKSIVLSFWFLTVACGNLIALILVYAIDIFEHQSHEFVFVAGLMFVDMLIFCILAHYHKSSTRLEKVQSE